MPDFDVRYYVSGVEGLGLEISPAAFTRLVLIGIEHEITRLDSLVHFDSSFDADAYSALCDLVSSKETLKWVLERVERLAIGPLP